MHKVIAIDGPSGSGKSTMAKKLAQSLGLLYIDTGAMYRALAYVLDKNNIPCEESSLLGDFLAGLNIKYGENDSQLIVINGEDLTHTSREHKVSALASEFSQLPQVRSFLLDFQRKLGLFEICVMEGRDIGTVVFPDAFCKIFVTASPEVRAKRRLDQLKEKSNTSSDLTYDQVLKDVIERDRLDTNRLVSPLKVAEGATYMDTSDMEEDEVLMKLIETSRLKGQEVGLSI
jgi:cytidylate kinase